MTTPTKPENPPAFPTSEQWNEWSELKAEYVPKTGPRAGMSLRDYFAAKAMQIAPDYLRYHCTVQTPETLAEVAYEIADAMLVERSKP